MNFKSKFLLILLITFLLFKIPSQILAEEIPNFPLGEKLIYKITWLKIPVGTGEIWAKEKATLNGREVFHVVGKVNTNKVLSKIFPMHDEIHSWIDAATFQSLQFEKKIDEIWLNTHEKMIFDASKNKGYFESFKTGQKNEFPITVPAHDVLSAFYWARRQSFVPGMSAQTVLCADQKDWALTVTAIANETIKHQGEKVKTIRVEPVTIVDGIEKRDRAWVNLSNDSARKPLRIVFKAPFGYVVGTLKKSGASQKS